MSDYRTFIVPYDFSEHAQAALAVAVDLGRRLGSDLHLVHVIRPLSYTYGYGAYGIGAVPPAVDMEEVHEGAMRSLCRVIDGIENPSGRLEPHVVEGAAIADAIREAAERLDADLIVMGTHGRTGLAHVFLGSVAERTLRCAPCPVLTVQASAKEGGE